MSRRRWALFVFGLAALLAFGYEVAGAQSTIAYVRPDVRADLAAAWDDTSATQRERAYCALYRTDSVPKFRAVVFTVFGIVRAIEDTARGDGYTVRFVCPPVKGTRLTTIHTHPPTTCDAEVRTAACVIGGADAWQCDVNSGDSTMYRKAGVPFALIQCDRHALVPYFAPSPSLAPAPPGASRLTASRYALAAGAVLAYNATCPFGRAWCERDPGGYVDEWKSPDKYGHALGAAAVTSLAMQSGIRPRDAWLITNAAGIGLELTQAVGGGHFSNRDVAWNALGATLPVVWRKVFR